MQIEISLETLFSSNLAPLLLKALVVGLLTAVCSAILGVPLVLKRYSMIGDGLSHVGFGALAIVTALGVSPSSRMLAALPIVILAAIFLLLLSESGKIKGDAAIALISTGSVAAGYIILNITGQGAGDICSSLFGASILTLQNMDVTLSVLLATGVLLVFVLLFSKIFAVTFDPVFARSSGVPVSPLNILLAVLSAVTVVVGMKMIGAIMISALIVFPALSAMRICKRFRQVIFCAAGLSALNFLLGLFFAATVEFRVGGQTSSLPIGPCVVFFNALTLLLCMGAQRFVKKKETPLASENASEKVKNPNKQ